MPPRGACLGWSPMEQAASPTIIFTRSCALKPGLIRLFFYLEQCFPLTNSSNISPNHPDSSRIQTSEQALYFDATVLQLHLWAVAFGWWPVRGTMVHGWHQTKHPTCPFTVYRTAVYHRYNFPPLPASCQNIRFFLLLVFSIHALIKQLHTRFMVGHGDCRIHKEL